GAAPEAAGAPRGAAPEPAAPPAGPPPPPPNAKTLPKVGPPTPEGQRGSLIAWDPITQKERWRTPGGGGIGGGTVTTASNLVFQVVNDGRLMAYTADKGEKLFEVQTGLRGGMVPPITFMLDGKQYVALAGGTGQVAPARNPEAAATTPAAGATPPTAAPPAPAPAVTAKPRLLVLTIDGKGALPVAN